MSLKRTIVRFGKAPPGYVPGVGRGATPIVTSAGLSVLEDAHSTRDPGVVALAGYAPVQDRHLQHAAEQDAATALRHHEDLSETRFDAFEGYDKGLFAGDGSAGGSEAAAAAVAAEDAAADAAYAQVDRTVGAWRSRLAARAEAVRAERRAQVRGAVSGAAALQLSGQSGHTTGEAHEQLNSMTVADWEAIPETTEIPERRLRLRRRAAGLRPTHLPVAGALRDGLVQRAEAAPSYVGDLSSPEPGSHPAPPDPAGVSGTLANTSGEDPGEAGLDWLDEPASAVSGRGSGVGHDDRGANRVKQGRAATSLRVSPPTRPSPPPSARGSRAMGTRSVVAPFRLRDTGPRPLPGLTSTGSSGILLAGDRGGGRGGVGGGGHVTDVGTAQSAALSLGLDEAEAVSGGVGLRSSVDPVRYQTALSQTRFLTGTDLQEIGRTESVVGLMLRSAPGRAENWILAARAQELKGRPRAALALALRGLRSVDRTSHQAVALWLEAARLTPSGPEVQALLARAVAGVPDSVRLWEARARAAGPDSAAQCRVYEEALSRVPNSVRLWIHRVALASDPSAARVWLRAALKRVPSSRALALALARLEAYPEAVKVLEAVSAALQHSDPVVFVTRIRLEEARWRKQEPRPDHATGPGPRPAAANDRGGTRTTSTSRDPGLVSRLAQLVRRANRQLTKRHVAPSRIGWQHLGVTAAKGDSPFTARAIFQAAAVPGLSSVSATPRSEAESSSDSAASASILAALCTLADQCTSETYPQEPIDTSGLGTDVLQDLGPCPEAAQILYDMGFDRFLGPSSPASPTPASPAAAASGDSGPPAPSSSAAAAAGETGATTPPALARLLLAAAAFEWAHGTPMSLDSRLERAVIAAPDVMQLWIVWARARWQAGNDAAGARAILRRGQRAGGLAVRADALWEAHAELEASSGAPKAAWTLLEERASAVSATCVPDGEAAGAAISPDPGRAARLWAQAIMLASRARAPRAAWGLLGRAQAVCPGSARLAELAGTLHLVFSPGLIGLQKAQEAYQSGLALAPDSIPLRLALARAQQRAGAWGAARTTLQAGLAQHPKSVPLHLGLLRVLVREADAVESDAGDAGDGVGTAQALRSETLAQLSRSLVACADAPEAERGRLWALRIELASPSRRRAACRAALQACPGSAAVLVANARRLWAARRTRAARQFYARAARLDGGLDGDAWAAWFQFETEAARLAAAGALRPSANAEAIGEATKSSPTSAAEPPAMDRADSVLQAALEAEPTRGERWTAIAASLAHRALSAEDILRLVAKSYAVGPP